jgi:hypothetical protein
MGSQQKVSPHMLDYDRPPEVPGTTRSAPTITHSPYNTVVDMSLAADDELVEDAMRAQAEQAESAAERFLELAEPEEEEDLHALPNPPIGVGGIDLGAREPDRLSAVRATTPISPPRNLDICVFQDSPPDTGRVSSRLIAQPARENWWLKQTECAYFRLERLMILCFLKSCGRTRDSQCCDLDFPRLIRCKDSDRSCSI